MIALTLAACVESGPPVDPPEVDHYGIEWADERAAVFTSINRARAEAGLAPLVYRSLLERIGDDHCRTSIASGVTGHFNTDGVPPYLRYLLAGGVGYHRENVGSLSTNYRLDRSEVGPFLADSLARMLAEQPPHDGHRLTLLDRNVTAIGIGLAVEGGEARVAHELAVEACRAAVPPPRLAAPSTTVSVEASLEAPWRVAAIEVLREPFPKPISVAEANARSAYRYPPSRALFGEGDLQAGLHGVRSPQPLRLGPGNSLSFRWFTGPAAGIEIAVVWARRHAGSADLAAVASFLTIVAETPFLPPALARFTSLGLPPNTARSGSVPHTFERECP